MDPSSVSRRQALIGTTGAALIVMVGRSPAGAALRWAHRNGPQPTSFSGAPTRTIRVVRARDQLDVLVELFDADVVGNQIQVTGVLPSIRITFGSQHTAEEMFDVAVPVIPTTALSHAAASTSTVVIPASGGTPFTLDGILDLAESALRVQSDAGTPDGTVTALEIPAGLQLSPIAGTTLTASRSPRTVGDTTEVWTAAFVPASGSEVLVAAINNTSALNLLNDRIPDAAARSEIVANTTGGDPTDAPVRAKRLWLSSSGAFARLRGEWPGATVTAWRQRIAAGRDLHVEITSSGYLAPFGHRAAITEIADRNFFADSGGGVSSALQLRRYLTLVDDTWEIGAYSFTPAAGNGLPFVSVRAVVDETVPIALVPVQDGGTDIPGVSDITRASNGNDLTVSYVATDRDGHEVTFQMPATFIADAVAHFPGSSGTSASRLVDAFNTADRNSRRDVGLHGQLVAFATPIAAGIDSTSKRTYEFRFELQKPVNSPTKADLEDARRPAFFPVMKRATVVDDTVGPGGGRSSDAFEVTHHPRWLEHGNDSAPSKNFDRSYLALTQPKNGTIGGDQPVSAVFVVELVAEVFNQNAGIGPDLPNASSPWNPSEALGPGSKVLGSFLLSALLEEIPLDTCVPGIDIPGTTVTVEGDTVTVVFAFTPKLRTSQVLGFIAKPTTKALLEVTTIASLTGSAPASSTTEMTVRDFTMVFPPGGLIGIVELDVSRMVAAISSDGALAVDMRITDWRLGDDLGFLRTLFDELKDLLGFRVDAREDGIGLGNALNLPNLGFGMLEVRNAHVDVSLDLSLTGGPVLIHVALGSAKSPVEAQLGTLGATFFVEFDVEFSGSNMAWRVEAGVSIFVEYGINAVAVSAAVRLRVGCSFIFDKSASGSDVKVVGSIALEGEIGVLGLIEVSAAIVGTVSYASATESIVVHGEIVWAVDTPLGGPDGTIPIGSTRFDIGDGASPIPPASNGSASSADGRPGTSSTSVTDAATFGDLYSTNDWSKYSAAFA